MIIAYLLILVVGFVLLIKGADFFVEGSSAAAKKFRVPSVVIGLTVVAMGTSAPELAVSLSAALEGSNEIAVSNVTGSNMFNLMAVLGICAVMSPLPSDKNIVKKDYPFMIFITLVLIVLSFGNYFGIALTQGTSSLAKCGILGRFGGIVLLILFAVYIFSTVKHALKIRSESSDDEYEVFFKPWQIILYIIGGLAAIVIGGKMVVVGAKSIALAIGMTETLVGLTVVAVGTSLPELVTSVIAAKKGENGLAMGNIIGSNIFNILFILGMSSVITPIGVNVQGVTDMIINFIMCIIVYFFAKTSKNISKGEGVFMIMLYAAYMVYAIFR